METQKGERPSVKKPVKQRNDGSKKPQATLPSSKRYWALLLDVTKHMTSFTCLFLRKVFLVEMTCARDCFLSLQMLYDKKCLLLHYAEHNFSGGVSTKTGRQKDTHWLQLRRSSAVARTVLWRLWEGHVSAASLGTSKFNQGFFHLSAVFFRWVFWWEVPV